MKLFKNNPKQPVTKTLKSPERNGKNSNAYIFLSADTNFNGEIKASSIILEGKVKGKVHADKAIRLKKGTLMVGEIHTKNFFAEKGSVNHGELHIDESEEEAETVINGEPVKKIAI